MPAPRRIFGNDTADGDGRDFSTTAQAHSPRATALYSYHKVRYPQIDHYRKCSLAKAHPHDKLGFPDREPSAQFGGGRSSELATMGKAHFADNTRKAAHKNCERTATLGAAGFADDAFLSEVAAGCGAGHDSTAYRRTGRYDSNNRVGQLGAAARAGTEMVTGGSDDGGFGMPAAAATPSAQDRHAATRRCRAEAAAIRAARGAQTLATLRVAHYGSGDASANACHGGFITNSESANATNLPWKAPRKPTLPSRFASTAPLPANLVARQSAANYGQNPTPSSAYKSSFCDRGGHAAPGPPARRGPNRGTFGIPGCSASSSSSAATGSPEDAEEEEEEEAGAERRASRGGRARYKPPPPPPPPTAARQGAAAAALSGEEALLGQLGALMQRSHGSLYEILLGAAPLRPVPGAPLPLEVRVGVGDVPRMLQRLRAQGCTATSAALCDLIAACSAGAQTAAIRQLQTAVRRTRVHAATRKDVARAQWHGQIIRDGPKVNSGAPKKIRL